MHPLLSLLPGRLNAIATATANRFGTRLGSATATATYVAGLFWREARLPGALLLAENLASGATAPLAVWAINGLVAVLAAAPAAPGADPWAATLPWLAALGGVFALRSADQAASAYLVAIARSRLQAALQRDVLERATTLPLATFEQPEYYQRLEHAQRLFRATAIYFLTGVATLISCAVAAAGLLVLFARAHWLLAFFLLATGLVRATIYGQQSVGFARTNYGHSPLRREMAYWADLLTRREPAAEVRLFGLGETLIGRWRRAFDSHLAAITAARRRVALAALGTSLAHEAANWSAAVALLWLALAGAIGIPALVALLYALASVRTVIRRAVFAVSEVAGYGADIGYLRHFIQLEPETPAAGQRSAAPPVRSPLVPLREGVHFSRVGFTYPGADRPALAGIDLLLRPGERIALVGENGAGKSTLVRLLLGLYRPTEGRITVDGVDLADIDPAAWRTVATAVFQEFMRYFTTVAENVGYGDAALLPALVGPGGADMAGMAGTADHPRVVAAAVRSGADEFIRALPDGYATSLGRHFGGAELSGGQWQRLALARAYVRDAQIVVLDEPTAALDPRAEVAVYERFRAAAAERCAVFISHRLGSARLADRIVVLHQGRLVEEGTHASLLAAGGEYARLYRLQASWYAAR